MQLAPLDSALLGGELGAAAQRAMRMLITYGEAVGAPRFIDIRSAHIDACLYHGPSTLDFVRRFADLGGTVRVPTTLNVAAVDTLHPWLHCGPPEYLDAQAATNALYGVLGCEATLTCAPYQRATRPAPGDHIAWAESNAIVFANSVLGARTDRYGDFTDLCAALTGRVPYAGFHRDDEREPRVLVDVVPLDASGLPRDMYFAAVGYRIGELADGRVPWIRGLPRGTTEDDFKALGATAASSGAIALFHADGLTPEAPQWTGEGLAGAGVPTVDIDAHALTSAVALLCPLTPGETIAAMCLGTPHFSLAEFASLAACVAGRRAAAGVDVFVSASREIASQVQVSPDWDALASFGVTLVVDTCTYVGPVVRRPGAIVTNSGKYAHYGPGTLQKRVGLMSMERCVRCAEAGVVVA
ncbi:MAG: aconitase X [Vicinamibacterales bacterium]